MHLWNAKNDLACHELELREIEFDPSLASALIDLLPTVQHWHTFRLINCHGGNIVNDVITAICTSCQLPIRTVELQQRISSVDSTTFFAITYGLKYAKHWRHLSLGVSTLDYEAGNNMARAIARNTWLETLNLSNSTIAPAAISPLSFGLRLNRTLQKIVLDGCALDDDQMATILMALQDHPSLRSLSLQQNQCHDQGMGAIAALLHYNLALEELDMSYLIRKKKEPQAVVEEEVKEEIVPEPDDKNDGVEESKDEQVDEEAPKEESVKEDTAKEPVEDTPKEPEPEPEEEETQKVRNTSLKTFQLAGNYLTDAFVESLLNVFGQGSALRELNLFGNRITDHGLRLIIKKIPKLEHLHSLWLNHNPFGPEAARELIPLMKTNFAIQDINIRSFDNPSMDEIQERLEHYCRLNRGGRRIFAKPKSTVPLSLWPLVMERAHTIHWGAVTSNITNVHSHAADVIYCLLHGPAIFENPEIM